MRTVPARLVFLDMDGVLFDFAAGVRGVFQNLPTDETWPRGVDDMAALCGVTQSQFWKQIDKRGTEWWMGIRPYPWANELLKLAEPHFLILTSPSHSPEAHAGKVLALQQLLGRSFREYIITPRKHKALLAGPERWLIDDNDDNAREFAEAGGRSILFPRPWNARHAESAQPLERVRASLPLPHGCLPDAKASLCLPHWQALRCGHACWMGTEHECPDVGSR